MVAVEVVLKPYGLLPEVHGRYGSECYVVGQSEFAEYADAESWVVVGYVGKPLAACLVGVAVVLELDVLGMYAEEEAVVVGTLVDVRTVHDLTCLCISSQGDKEKEHG